MRRLGIIFCCGLAAAALIGVLIYFWTQDTPKYCRVRFGTEPHSDVIVATTSNALLLFRSGDARDTPERYPFNDGSLPEGVTIPAIRIGPLTNTDKRCSYSITSVSEMNAVEPSPRHALMIHVAIEGDTHFSQYCDVQLSDSPDNLKYAHFDGPLSVGPVTINGKVPPGTQLVIGGEATDVRAVVATLDAVGGCWTVSESGGDKFPSGVHPTVTVAFPSAEASTPLVHSFPLDQFC